ncbi:4-hydroxy-3-methylbut-2-enyl diphosphate reductase [Hypnocyclicus thermotrophus]|uniref:4-hydroxy-3-methylbut-2-enyl diphosphate reductase n=1 Tax=Hypnocyclicus thermotrophus TaxID=1627895 RepID=A0AA46I5V6_9FUSO|nr:4-hydroxy-3-methylbut-2-enyl diphosphate reductase [Hypnocyclicus thermotrophus]TDT69822.1 4-hydroxy-3-methylbut-2-enyl diphosphate reductase [Hypnocyclicus thermotrophus]
MKIKKIVHAKKMGFCIGVKNAVNLAEEILAKNFENVYIVGMLVHNNIVIEDLIKKGAKIISEEDILNNKYKFTSKDAILVRAHGTVKEVYDKISDTDSIIYDAACIFVNRARDILKNKINENYKIIFIGDKNHPEVKGIISYGKEKVNIFANLDELKNSVLNKKEKYLILAQTTLNKNMFNEIKEYIKENFIDYEIANTICGATFERQRATEQLATQVELLLVIGSNKSSNTKKLYNIGKNLNKNTYLIEKKEDIDKRWFEGIDVVGITAGASTPEKSIHEIEKMLKGEIL